MTKTFNPLDDKDYRTINVSDNVVIMTRGHGNPPIKDYYYGHNSVIHHEMIDLPHHEFEPGAFLMKDYKRYATRPEIPENYMCTCGEFSLKPVKNGLRHQSVIECQCENCRAKMFVEIPYIRDNTKHTPL